MARSEQIRATAQEIALMALERARKSKSADDCLAYCRSAETVMRIAQRTGWPDGAGENEWDADAAFQAARSVS